MPERVVKDERVAQLELALAESRARLAGSEQELERCRRILAQAEPPGGERSTASLDFFERDSVAEALAHNEQLLGLFVEHAPAAIAMFDHQMRYLLASRRWKQSYDLEPSRDLRGLDHYQLVRVVPERWREAHRRGLQGEVTRADFDRFDRLDGEVRWVRWEVRPWYGLRGEIGGILVFSEDVTERHRVEEELARSNRLLHLALRSSPLVLMRQDTELRHTWSFGPGFGEQASKLIGKTDAEILECADDAVRTMALKREVIQSGKARRCEMTLLWDGRERVLDLALDPERDEQGRVVGITCAALDITERRRSYQELLRSEKLASVGRMATAIAHEIHNPMEIVGNALYLAMAAPDLPPCSRKHLELAVQELERMAQLTRQALIFHGDASTPLPFDLGASLEGILRIYTRRLSNRGVRVETRFRAVPAVFGFDGQCCHAIANLLSNSLDAIRPGEGRIAIRLATARGADGSPWVRCTVADNGCGMAPPQLQRLFEPFFTTKTVGSGLGLWATRHTIDKHGGHIRVRSKPGVGTVFSLFFPSYPGVPAPR